MKTLALAVLISFCFMGTAQAEDGLTLKQGIIYIWDSNQVKNYSCVEIIKTKAGENWPKWVNLLWDGNTIEGGISYDLAGVDSVALMLGRRLGSLADYLPLEYPLLDKVDISLYPIGIALKDPFDNPEAQIASGLAMLKMSLKF